MAIDLNALRSVVIENQRNNRSLPSDPSKQVVVDKEGKVLFGDQARNDDVTTQVPQETFAIQE